MSLLRFKTGYNSIIFDIVDHRWHNDIYIHCLTCRITNLISKLETEGYSIVDGCIDEARLMHRDELIPLITRDEVLRCIDEISRPLRTQVKENHECRCQSFFDRYQFTDEDKNELIHGNYLEWFMKQNWFVKLASERPFTIAEFNNMNSAGWLWNRYLELIRESSICDSDIFARLDSFYSQLVQFKNVPIPLPMTSIIEVKTGNECERCLWRNISDREVSDEALIRAIIEIKMVYDQKSRGNEILEPLDTDEDEYELLLRGELYKKCNCDAVLFMKHLLFWI